MRRTVLVLVMALGALLAGSPSSLRAQSKDDPNWFYMPQSVAGITECVPGGVRSIIDMEVSDDARQLEVTRAHEFVHQRQLRDRSLCTPTWQKLLSMETEAYCDADAVMIQGWGGNSAMIYSTILGALLAQFRGNIASEKVASAWFDRCGSILHMTSPDGTTVHPAKP